MTKTSDTLDPEKTYSVSRWASVDSRPEGRLIWDVLRDDILRTRDENNVVNISKLDTPKLVGVSDNPGLADYFGETA